MLRAKKSILITLALCLWVLLWGLHVCAKAISLAPACHLYRTLALSNFWPCLAPWDQLQFKANKLISYANWMAVKCAKFEIHLQQMLLKTTHRPPAHTHMWRHSHRYRYVHAQIQIQIQIQMACKCVRFCKGPGFGVEVLKGVPPPILALAM